jgi:hypothetical protein
VCLGANRTVSVPAQRVWCSAQARARLQPCPGTTGCAVLQADPISPTLLTIYIYYCRASERDCIQKTAHRWAAAPSCLAMRQDVVVFEYNSIKSYNGSSGLPIVKGSPSRSSLQPSSTQRADWTRLSVAPPAPTSVRTKKEMHAWVKHVPLHARKFRKDMCGGFYF